MDGAEGRDGRCRPPPPPPRPAHQLTPRGAAQAQGRAQPVQLPCGRMLSEARVAGAALSPGGVPRK